MQRTVQITTDHNGLTMSGGGYPKFRNDRGVPEICIGVKEFTALDSSRFLTNLTVTEQAHIRELWAQKRMPVEMYGVVQLFRWSQSSRRRLLNDDLFKITLGAALAATNLMIIEGLLFSDPRYFSPKLARAEALRGTTRTRSSFHREILRMRSSMSREAR